MTHAIAIKASQDPAKAIQWLRSSWQLARHDPAVREQVAAAVNGLTVQCNEEWLLMRIAALLEPYFDKGTPAMVRAMEAEDWAEELRDFPKWAIEAAVRWWKSADNQDRRKRPLEGDIGARVRREMDAVRAAQAILDQPLAAAAFELPAPIREKVLADVANDILARAGFRPKTFGGES